VEAVISVMLSFLLRRSSLLQVERTGVQVAPLIPAEYNPRPLEFTFRRTG